MTNTTTPATPDRLVERIVNSLRACLMGTDEAADQWTFAGMQDAFFRWPVVERELRHVLAALTTKADAAAEGVERAKQILTDYTKDAEMRVTLALAALSRTPSQANDAAGRGEIERLRAMLVDDPNDVTAGVPEDVIAAGMEVKDRIYADLQNYVSGETTDWDEGMDCAAVFKAMLQRALNTSQAEKQS